MRIAAMGAGGIGGYLGGRLAQSGHDISFVARGAHLAALKEEGLHLLSPLGDAHIAPVRATDRSSDIGPVDLVLFAVKLWDTEEAVEALLPLIGPATRVLTFQNGIDSQQMLARRMPADRIVKAAIYVSAHIDRPGAIRHSGGTQRLIVDRRSGDPLVLAFHEACAKSVGLSCELSDAIDDELWSKFVRLSTFSAGTALMRSGIGAILTDPGGRELLGALLDEGSAIAAAEGHPMPSGFREKTLAFYATFPPETRASMAEDLAHGRRLELPWLSGRMHELGEKHRIPTPSHTTALRALGLYVNGQPA